MMETTGPALWLVVLTIGAVALIVAMVYGVMRNRQRSLGERVATEVETRREYEREDRDEQ
ncbi:hypothetical protein ACFOOL_09520 [Devosia honganensis]|uniref:Uncharacterized protein n=1 Tax=Devosia honganensis TaxID=1610527 RepID=A0ABV7X4G8_9HYPH